MYIWALDLSLSNSGITIFDEKENPICLFSIPTSNKLDHGKRLKVIGETLLKYRRLYPTNTIILESGFYRFAASTEAIYKVHGIVNYLFSDCEQIYFAPSTIKKIVGGNGKTNKEEIKKIVSLRYPNLILEDTDQSDAVSIMMCYLESKKGLKK